MNKIVELKNITMNYYTPQEETLAINDLSLCVYEGEFVSIVGPSGCGKSTLLGILSGLIKPTKGEIFIKDVPIEESKIQMGYMLQKDHLLGWRTILSNATLGLEIQKNLNQETLAYTEKLLEDYGLGSFKSHYPSQLSGGMRQRAALIRTLATNPEILLLDEPFSALDYQTRLHISDEIGTIIKEQKKTAVLITHDISEALALADRVIVLTQRPAKVKNIHEIKLSIPERSALKSREAPEFKDYFNYIWKELDVHV